MVQGLLIIVIVTVGMMVTPGCLILLVAVWIPVQVFLNMTASKTTTLSAYLDTLSTH